MDTLSPFPQTTSTGPLAGAARLRSAISSHWPEYLMEAGLLAGFMISACVTGVLLEHPASPIHQAIENAVARRVLAGLVMGVTAIALIYSPWGKQSGAHMNPSVTLAFLSLGKVKRPDAAFYIAAQFAGGIVGVLVSDLLIGLPLRHSSVNYAVTIPGPGGSGIAFWAEFLISFLLMLTVLMASNTRRLSRFTGLFAGALIAIYIAVENPFSGMSMNPARTFGSAFPADEWSALWVYFIAPPVAMLAAGQLYRFRRGAQGVFCAKLHHHNGKRCIFRCNHGALDGNK